MGVVSESDLLRLLSVEDEKEGGLWLPSPFEVFEVPFRDLVKWEQDASESEGDYHEEGCRGDEPESA